MCSTFKRLIVTTIINIFLFRRSRKVNRSNLSPVCPNRIVKLPSHGTGKYIISTRNLFNLESIFIIIFIIFNNKYNNITIKVKYNNIYNINIYNTFIFFFRDSTVVKASKDIMISFNGVDMKLSITSASTSYSGTYKVVVSNEYGQDESSARLVVKVRKEIRKWSKTFIFLSLYIYIYLSIFQCRYVFK